jgi:hypothetical protein
MEISAIVLGLLAAIALLLANGYMESKKKKWKRDLLNTSIKREPMTFEKEKELQRLARMVMDIDHVGVQCDDIHKNEQMHQTILAIDKLDKYQAIRLLVHVIHVQQLQLANAKIEFDKNNPFKDMVDFDHIECYVSCNSHDMATLY